ncbi:MAG: hypothetical protein ACE5E5_05770 [Phycisphaerae bacterium]
MSTLVPNRWLFSLEFPIAYRTRPPKLDGTARGWAAKERLPKLGSMDGATDFADVWACWHESGVYLAVKVTGKRKPLQCDPTRYWDGDNVRLCIDTRDARTNRRATRFCRQFYFLPRGGGKNGKAPVAGVGTIQRAMAEGPPVPDGALAIASSISKGGYFLKAHVSAEALHGFDPDEHPRIGFYLMVEDAELGQQFPTVGDDLSWHLDPSTWPTAVLSR